MSIKFGTYKHSFGDKVTGFVYAELYDCKVWGFCFMSNGVWVVKEF